jgi:hypothetical protein
MYSMIEVYPGEDIMAKSTAFSCIRVRALPQRSAALLFALTALACYDDAPTEVEQPAPQPTFGTSSNESANGIANHTSGIYVVGDTEGPLDGPNLGMQDAFVRKYHPQGDLLWRSQFGTHLGDVAVGVAADNDGNAYVAGATEASLAGSRGSEDAFLRRYSSSGAVLWTRQFGSSAADGAAAVAVDKFGAVYVVGFTTGKLGQDPENGGVDAFMVKYEADGDEVWTRQFGTSATDQALGVATDHVGNIYVAGLTLGSLAGANQGASDAFVRKYNNGGSVLWTVQFGTPQPDDARGIAVDGNANAIVAGQTSGALEGAPAGGTDVFYRKYSSQGVVVAGDQFGTSEGDFARAVSTDDENSFYITGWTNGALSRMTFGQADVYVRKYDSSNSIVWTRVFGTAASDLGLALAARDHKSIYVGGGTAGSLAGINRGADDAFLRLLNQNGNPVWTDQ